MKNILFIFSAIIFLTACNRERKNIVIGVSQCSDDEWRRKMNAEIQREALFYDNVKVEICTAKDNNNTQIEDIQYFINKGVDLLIVSPNEAISITPVVEKAFDKKIPVVVVDRKISLDKYTAFIGANNYEIGRAVGRYITTKLRGEGYVVELTGLTGSTPAIERHEGFVNSIKKFPNIKLLASIDAGWLQSKAEKAMDSILTVYPKINLVFSQNDFMAVGAYLSARNMHREKKISFIGVDALPGKNLGVEQVLKGVLDATFIYPTGGGKVMQLAMNILQKQPYERENTLSTAIIDRTNARVVHMQTDEIMEQDNKLKVLNDRIDIYLARYTNQQSILYSILIVIGLLMLVTFFIFRAYWTKKRLISVLQQRNDKILKREQQLQERNDQLMELSKQLEEATHAKLVFFTNVSHDFRTPLTLVADPVEHLLNDPTLTPSQSFLLKIVSRNVNILLRLVNQVLDFRKYENGKLELSLSRVNLRKQILEWNNNFQSVAQKKHIHFVFDDGDKTTDYNAVVDIGKLERIYFNLLSNAFKFTPENGKIKVSLSTFLKDNKHFIRLIITDSGKGVLPEHIQNIFERFYQIDVHYEGSGIGLALVKAFVDLHSGIIRVESALDKGTVFTIDLPITQPGLAEDTILMDDMSIEKENYKSLFQELVGQPENDVMLLDPQKETVLVIDDNQDIRDYVCSLLHNEYSVIKAVNGNDGLKKAMKYVPDVIVCDVMMPVMDGLECCRRLKNEVQTSHIPVMLLTACSLDEQRIQGFECGADSYIAKPVNFKLLLARIRNLIDNQKRLKQFFGEERTFSDENIGEIEKNFINKFRQALEDNLSNSELSVEDLGLQLGLSRVQLYRKVKALTNYSPVELLRITRLKKAAALLSSSEMNISEVSYEVGFTAPSYFTKCFKEYFGENPNELVKRWR